MKIKRSFILIASMSICVFYFAAYSFSSDSGEKLYTAYNIWYESGKEKALWCINYKTGIMIPAGTEVSIEKIKKNTITFITSNDQKEYIVNFNTKFHPNKTIEDYKDMMFSEKDFNQLTKGMTQDEIEAIKEGVIKVGMSKQAVIVTYGYPPEHKTPDLDGNVWQYWMNRFRTKKIHFDDNGYAIQPPDDSDQL